MQKSRPYLKFNFTTCTTEVKISSPSMTQGGQPCKQQNCAQGGPPCASYLLHRADPPYKQQNCAQGGPPCASYFLRRADPPPKQQNCAQGGLPCASYKLRRAVRPSTSKMVHRADRPVHHLSCAGRSALLPAK